MKESKDLYSFTFFNNFLEPFDRNGWLFYKQQLKMYNNLTG